jgi:hypothetical protein
MCQKHLDFFFTYLRRWALPEKLPIVQPLKTFPEFMEHEGSLPCSQEPSTGPYPEPDRSSPYQVQNKTKYSAPISPWLYSPCEPWPPLQFLHPYTLGRTPWTGDQPVVRLLPTHRINAQTSMPRMRFKPTIPAFERAKRGPALDRAATVISVISFAERNLNSPEIPVLTGHMGWM